MTIERSKGRCFLTLIFYSQIRLKKICWFEFSIFSPHKSPIKRPNFFHGFFAIGWLVAVRKRILWRFEKLKSPIKRLIFFHGLFAIGWLVLYLREYYDVLRNLT